MSLSRSELLKTESFASELILKNHIVAPSVDVEEIAHNLGLDVIPYDLGEGVSGALFIQKNKGFIGYNPTHHKKRIRFTIAHEIGHFILHKKSESNKIFIDKDFIVKYRSTNNYSSSEYKQELEANSFAAELLMPKIMIRSALSEPKFNLPEPDLIEELAKLFDVSIPAMTIKLSNMNIVQ